MILFSPISGRRDKLVQRTVQHFSLEFRACALKIICFVAFCIMNWQAHRRAAATAQFRLRLESCSLIRYIRPRKSGTLYSTCLELLLRNNHILQYTEVVALKSKRYLFHTLTKNAVKVNTYTSRNDVNTTFGAFKVLIHSGNLNHFFKPKGNN